MNRILWVDALESRRHLSAALKGSTLIVQAETSADTIIHVGLDQTGNHVQVDVNGESPVLFDKARVDQLQVFTFAGNDTIVVDPTIVKLALIRTGRGDDTITTGGERDFIFSGAGKDLIRAGGGNDYVVAAAGDDTVNTGGGKDRIWGDAGKDVINSGGGNDNIFGGRGNDSINAGAGDDTVHANQGIDSIDGGMGNDRLWGQKGDDLIIGGEGDDTLGGIVGPHNTLLGGSGKDTFFVKSTLDGQVNDFDSVTDLLHLQPQSTDSEG